MTTEGPVDFIRAIVADDLAAGRNNSRVRTRFPPEPNGYLHIGHAKSICLNFGVAQEFGGACNLRFDDTNPAKEDVEYVDAIKQDVRWLGFDWEDREYYASDHFEQLYQWAVELIGKGLAYVDYLTPDEVREHRGTLTEPGRESPHRNRPIAENLELFRRMRAGEFADGVYTLRAKIDMASPNINLRDPALYRIRRATHHRTGDDWCIYPMYDFAHALSDAIEGITHSLCTLEFEDHRPLYDWCIANCSVPSRPRQIEFARLNLTYTVMSKRRLLTLVEEGVVQGWDDPRMPTLSGIRRRGYTPEAMREFAARIGVAKRENLVDVALLEDAVRDDLNKRAPRAMAVLRPLKVVIDNFPEDQVDQIAIPVNQEDASAGIRQVPFSRELYIERDDFMEEPPKKFFRLAPGREVRLRGTYFVTCDRVEKNAAGEVTALHCTYDPATRDGNAPDGRKPKATIHWVSAAHAIVAEVRLYDRLFNNPTPGDEADGGDWRTSLNPTSLEVLRCPVEPTLASASAGDRYQFERLGYFAVDPDSTPGNLVFNRTVTLKDTWARVARRTGR
ncbi:MAG: glutamine--tRNA ligase/YqeY domain fusion protein [Acidobacteria bacterium]|nr:glutamine--tRNA ligase/YqeY domain fusion protein [Acidobacteriota bacterium]